MKYSINVCDYHYLSFLHIIYMPNIIDSEVCLKPSLYEMQYLYVNGEIKETVQPLPECHLYKDIPNDTLLHQQMVRLI